MRTFTNSGRLDIENDRVEMSHGAGGRAMAQLIDQLFLKYFDSEVLAGLNDSACVATKEGQLVISTDSYVVTPLFFPGGNIGDLAVNGTVNDVAMAGARPLYLSVGFILEEGFSLKLLSQIVSSMAIAARQSGVTVVTGDTKVVERGKADGVFINTTGVGYLKHSQVPLSPSRVRPGDKIIVSGYIGDHGAAILTQRDSFEFSTNIKSDSAALNTLVSQMLKAAPDIHCLRDPTRGGVAAICHEVAQSAHCGIRLVEGQLPIRDTVKSLCEFLGIDPLCMANEGKLICFCPPEQARNILATMRQHPLGIHSAVIGEVVEDTDCQVAIETEFGSGRVVPYLMGEPLPRIC